MSTTSTTICTIAKAKNIKNPLDFEIILASHDWRLEKTEEHGHGGIVVIMKCKRCSADRVSVLSPRN
jgi:hypothetical protein